MKLVRLEISGVPSFAINEMFTLSGAQKQDTFTAAINRSATANMGEACEVDVVTGKCVLIGNAFLLSFKAGSQYFRRIPGRFTEGFKVSQANPF